jgi:hypothetical protein
VVLDVGFVFAFGLALGLGEAVVVVLGVVDVDVAVDVVGVLTVLAALLAALGCFDPPQPAIASAAINAPES